MLKVLFCLIFFMGQLWAKEIKIEVMAKTENVTVEKTQEHLLAVNGYRQAITSELEEQKLDSSLFWTKLEAKKLSESAEAEFLKPYFENEEISIATFTDASKTSTPDGRIVGMFSATIDPAKIAVLYNEVIANLEELRAKTFYILASIEIDSSLKWEDMGVVRSEQFIGAILDSWKKMAQNHLPGFERYQVLEKDFITASDAMSPQSVTLKWKSMFKKTSVDPVSKTINYELTAQYILVNTKSNEVLLSFDFPIQKREFSNINNKSLSSGLASLVYNLLLSQKSKLSSALDAASKIKVQDEIVVALRSKVGLSEVYKVINLLQDNFKDIKLVAQMKSFSSEGTQLLIRAEGGLEKILESLSKNQGSLVLDEQKLLIFNRTDKSFAILPKEKNN